MERVFRYLASLLYFFDRLDKLLALESSAAGREKTGGNTKEERGERIKEERATV